MKKDTITLFDNLFKRYKELNKQMYELEDKGLGNGTEWKMVYQEEQAVIKLVVQCGLLENLCKKVSKNTANFIIECLIDDIVSDNENKEIPIYING